MIKGRCLRRIAYGLGFLKKIHLNVLQWGQAALMWYEAVAFALPVSNINDVLFRVSWHFMRQIVRLDETNRLTWAV